ncbi:MAG: tRNA pseudouridine(55) synthase TruB [Bacteroidetes bacterium]|nr:tRNA pseudouridine(55) synthase TruB [Bacteroidota bacterium]
MFPAKKNDFQKGQVLIFSKPYHWTSFDLVRKIKIILQKQLNQKIKIGHAGTLDPLATGLMILCTGKATKRISGFQDLNKEYIATIELGKTTPSFDLETEFDNKQEFKHIRKDLFESVLKTFIGEIYQIPPAYSAKKHKGKRAYEFARRGVEIELKPARINIYKIELLDFNLPLVKLRILCSKGTYIRALARDIGKALDSGAYLKTLERTRIGDYCINDAFTIESFEKELFNVTIHYHE